MAMSLIAMENGYENDLFKKMIEPLKMVILCDFP
jgi:hypothetical protein